jgi:hypothetical protein
MSVADTDYIKKLTFDKEFIQIFIVPMENGDSSIINGNVLKSFVKIKIKGPLRSLGLGVGIETSEYQDHHYLKQPVWDILSS